MMRARLVIATAIVLLVIGVADCPAQTPTPTPDAIGRRVAQIELTIELPRTLAEKKLRAALSDPAARVRGAALGMLGKRRFGGAWIVDRLKHDRDSRVRKAALAALAGFGSTYAAIVIDHLQHSAPELRATAVTALVRMRVAGAQPRLVRMLYDPALSVRIAAIKALTAWPEAGTAKRLTDLLGDPSDTLRREAIAALVRLKARQAVPRLIQRLAAVELGERQLILDALGRIGDPRSIPSLLPLIWDKNALVSSAAIEALGRLAAVAAIEPLLRYLSTVGFAGAVAVVALNRIGGPRLRARVLELLRRRPAGELAKHLLQIVAHHRIREAVPLLLAAMRASSADRLLIVRTLRAIRDRRAGAALAELLSAPESAVGSPLRQQLILALGALGEQRWVPLVARHLRSTKPPLVLAALEALGSIGGPLAARALIEASSTLRGGLLLHALEVLRGLRPFAAPERLLVRLGDADVRIREMMAQVLGASGDLSLIPRLRKLADSEVFLGNRDALRALGTLMRKKRDADALGLLVKRLRDDDLETKLSALQALGELSLSAAAGRIRKLASSTDYEVRMAVADLLGDLPSSSDNIETLRQLAIDSSARVRTHALYSLGTLRVRPQLALFREKLRSDPAPGVRANAARALGRIRALEARSELEACLVEEPDWVAASCAWALNQLPLRLSATRLAELVRSNRRWFVRGNLARLYLRALEPTARRAALLRLQRQDAELAGWVSGTRSGPEDELAMMQLVDQRYRSMPDRRYLLIFPDGEIKVGFTNRFGAARQDHVPRKGMRWDFPEYRP